MVEDRNRDKEGRFSSEVTREDLYETMEELEPYTTRELADLVGIPRRTALNYLDELADEDLIRKKKPEPRRAIWIRPAE